VNSEKLNQWLTTLANFGVIVGILFLIFEIRLNTLAIQAQTRDSISEKEMQLYGWQATSPELAAVVRKAYREGAEYLDPVESQMWFGYMEAFFREHENALYQFQQGLFSAEDFSGRVENMREVIKISAFRDHWTDRRDRYSPSLRAEIDRFLEEIEPQEAN
jgi:hypothetical protein